jgi:hypothetical protein
MVEKSSVVRLCIPLTDYPLPDLAMKSIALSITLAVNHMASTKSSPHIQPLKSAVFQSLSKIV